jgi:SAM-dependent methyltransferase
MIDNSTWDPIWEKVFSEQEWGRYPGESLIRFIAKNFYKTERNQIKLLEIGCGTGANIWFMSRENFSVFGIDGSKTAIKKAYDILKKDNLAAELTVGDINCLPYKDCFFDAVIDVECICCNRKEDSVRILGEINRVLKPSGYLYSRTFTEEMYVGRKNSNLSKFEYTEISDGPLQGKGFVRLIDKLTIPELYGKLFNVVSIDKLEATHNNNELRTSEWIIISQKQ